MRYLLYTSHIAQQSTSSQQEVLYTSHSSKILSGDTVHIAQQYLNILTAGGT
jgi:hypothetical protein